MSRPTVVTTRMRAEDLMRVTALLEKRKTLAAFCARVEEMTSGPISHTEEEAEGPRLCFGEHEVTLPLQMASYTLRELISTIDSALRRFNVEPPQEQVGRSSTEAAHDHQD